MRTTEWRPYQDGQMRVIYGFKTLGPQEPYFSIIAEFAYPGDAPGDYDSSAASPIIAEVFPELTSLIRWHLCFRRSGPMHYLDNGRFWYQEYQRKADDAALDAFKRTVVFGALPTDLIPAADADTGELLTWLEQRRTRLQQVFVADMRAAGLW